MSQELRNQHGVNRNMSVCENCDVARILFHKVEFVFHRTNQCVTAVNGEYGVIQVQSALQASRLRVLRWARNRRGLSDVSYAVLLHAQEHENNTSRIDCLFFCCGPRASKGAVDPVTTIMTS